MDGYSTFRKLCILGAESQGRCVGMRLIRAMSEKLPGLRGYEQCVVKTLQSTPHTNKFYIENGFQHLHNAFGRVRFAQKIPKPNEIASALDST